MPLKIRLLIFAGIACLALGVRLPSLNERPMHTDEAVNGYITGQVLAGEKYQYDPRDRHGPALYALALPLARAAGQRTLAELTESTLRLGPVLVGAATILLLALAANQIGFVAAVFAALLFAFGPLPVYYSRYFIHETLFVAATLGLLIFGWRALTGGSVIQGVLAGLSAGLMLACKETALLHFAAIGAAGAWWLHSVRRSGMFPDQSAVRRSVRCGIVALVAFLILVVGFYTWGGRHWQGLLDLVHSIPRFAARAAGEGHEKPFWYYLALLGGGWSGAVVLGMALLGGIGIVLGALASGHGASVSGRQRAVPEAGAPVALVIYAIAICGLYSFIPYKTPWLALNLWLPLTLLAGFGGAVIWRMARPGTIRILVVLAAVVMAGLLGRDTCRRVYERPNDERNPYAYSQTVDDLLRLPERISQLARQIQTENSPRIAVIAADAWPLPWYLRRFPQVGFWQPNQDPGKADFYITSPETWERPGAPWEKWRPEFFGVHPEVLVILWSPFESEVGHE